jgi:hypothetical protein
MRPTNKVKRCLSQDASPAREPDDEVPSTEPIGAVRANAARTLEHLGLTAALPRRHRERRKKEASGSADSGHLRSHSASASAKPPVTLRMSVSNSPAPSPGSPSRAATTFRNVRLAQSIHAAGLEHQERADWKNKKHRSSPTLPREKLPTDPHPVPQHPTRQIQGRIPSRQPMMDLREKFAPDRRRVASQPPIRTSEKPCPQADTTLIPPESPKELTAARRAQQFLRQQNRKSLNFSFEARRPGAGKTQSTPSLLRKNDDGKVETRPAFRLPVCQQTATLEEMVQGVLANEGHIDSPRDGATTNTPPRDDQD